MNKDIWIDGDHLLHIAANEPVKNDSLDGELLDDDVDIEFYKNQVRDVIQEYVDIVEVESIFHNWYPENVYVVFTDSKGNFRHNLTNDYKANRKGKQPTEIFMRLKRWVRKEYIYVRGFEADDIVAYHVRKGGIGVSTDKDLLFGVPGRWYDSYHKTWIKTTRKEAKRFTLLQTLAGDSVDNIRGIPRVGMKTAENLLVSNGDTWEGIVTSYENAGLTEEDAILTRRLIGMDQTVFVDGNYRLKLFKDTK